MSRVLRKLLHPMNLAAFVTWLAVAIGSRAVDPSLQALQWTFLVAFLLALLGGASIPHQRQGPVRAMLLGIEGVCAIAVIWLSPRSGAAPVLLVVFMAQIAMYYPPRVTVSAAIALNAALYLLLREGGHREPLLATTLYVGFQAFAALSSHYAKTAEAAR
ncbi:MAG: sensor histidine kinase, partial [Casimicrobiaceae bacterium]